MSMASSSSSQPVDNPLPSSERSSTGCVSDVMQCLLGWSGVFQRDQPTTTSRLISTLLPFGPTIVDQEKRGTIAFFSTYRPPQPLHIYTCPVSPTSKQDEVPMVDGETKYYNYNGRELPPDTLKALLRRRGVRLHREVTKADVDSGRVSGLVFVSERTEGLETLHLAIRFHDEPERSIFGGFHSQIKVVNFADMYGIGGKPRMEDSGCGAGDYLIYVSTMEPNQGRRQPWTAVYGTHLVTGQTQRLTPPRVSDLSPSISPSGKKIALASLQYKPGGWTGEIEDLRTDIIVMGVEEPYNRTMVIQDGGWPTWGSDDIIFFHRQYDKDNKKWGVFQADISAGLTKDVVQVTPDDIHAAVTPVAIDANTVVVATIRQASEFDQVRAENQYRHIEIFKVDEGPQESTKLTQIINPLVDHLNPFVVRDHLGQIRIGYHRCHDFKHEDNFQSQLEKIESPEEEIGVCRASGVFPSFSKDGKKLAFVNNEFTIVYVVDQRSKRQVYKSKVSNGVFSPIWDQSGKDILYVCVGPSFNSDGNVEIWAIHGVSGDGPYKQVQLTTGGYNNAFPSTNPQGTKFVFRSTRDWMALDKAHKHKNLYIMEDAEKGEHGGQVTRITNGPWIDTHCEWSPNGQWIVFSSTRDKPDSAPETDNGLDPGYYAIFIMKADDPTVVVRVMGSGNDLAGHVNHPFFSPDGKSISVVSDLAGVSADPMSMPLFLHSVRPYGDIFIIDINPDDIYKNEHVSNYKRLTHSRFENSTALWSKVTIRDMKQIWEKHMLFEFNSLASHCPFLHHNGGHGFHMTGHLCVNSRLC